MLDIIIPVLNEENILLKKEEYYKTLGEKANLIFVDGGSMDDTRDIAGRYGGVVTCRPGRSIQKNQGVQSAHSENLLFLHVDTFIDPGTIPLITGILKEKIECGCFSMKIQDKARAFRVYEKAVNFRSRNFGIIDGDLGMFIKRSTFNKLGGFDRLPVMEDIVFSRKVRRVAKVKVLSIPIYVSSRKWHEKGFIRTFFLYTLAHIQLLTGMPFFKFEQQDPKAEVTPVSRVAAGSAVVAIKTL